MADPADTTNTGTDIQTVEKSILENLANPVQSYEVDGEKVTQKDALKQLDALERMKAHRVSRNPLAAVGFFHLPPSSGMR